MKEGFLLLAEVWSTLEDDEETGIMTDFAKFGRQILQCCLYFVAASSFIGLHCTMLGPAVLDYLIPLDKPRPKILLAHSEFGIDTYENYYKIYFAYFIFTYVTSILLVSVDSMFITCVIQSTGVFALVKHRVTKAVSHYEQDVFVYSKICSAIRLHNQAYQFLDIIESTYSLAILIVVSATVSCSCIGPVYCAEKMEDRSDVLKVVVVLVVTSFHLAYLALTGQWVMDKSSDLFQYLYTVEWYRIPDKSKKLIKLMMLRSMRPCILTAGGLIVMNVENAGKMLKTIVSYTMVALSVR